MENWSIATNPTGRLCFIAINDLSVVTPDRGISTVVWKSMSVARSKSESQDLGRTTSAVIPETPQSVIRKARHGAVPGRMAWDLATDPGIRCSSRRISPDMLKKQRMPEMESGRLDWDARRNTDRLIWTHIKLSCKLCKSFSAVKKREQAKINHTISMLKY